MAIAGDVTHQLRYSHFAATFGIPGIAVVAVLAAHQAALHEYDKAYSRAIDSAAGFDGMDPANGAVSSGWLADFNGRDPINDRHKQLQRFEQAVILLHKPLLILHL